MPASVMTTLSLLVQELKDLFHTSPGATMLAQHFIPVSGNLVKIQPWHIQAYYVPDRS